MCLRTATSTFYVTSIQASNTKLLKIAFYTFRITVAQLRPEVRDMGILKSSGGFFAIIKECFK